MYNFRPREAHGILSHTPECPVSLTSLLEETEITHEREWNPLFHQTIQSFIDELAELYLTPDSSLETRQRLSAGRSKHLRFDKANALCTDLLPNLTTYTESYACPTKYNRVDMFTISSLHFRTSVVPLCQLVPLESVHNKRFINVLERLTINVQSNGVKAPKCFLTVYGLASLIFSGEPFFDETFREWVKTFLLPMMLFRSAYDVHTSPFLPANKDSS